MRTDLVHGFIKKPKVVVDPDFLYYYMIQRRQKTPYEKALKDSEHAISSHDTAMMTMS